MFDIRDFGAKTDGRLCTKSIQNAIDKCFLSGGGIVVVPAGEFLTGGVRIRSNVTLHLLSGAVLKASCNPEDYFDFLNDDVEPISEDIRKVADTVMEQAKESASVQPCSRWNNAIIRAICAENIEIRGEKDSIIDGMDCYDECGEEGYRGPHGINIWYCKNIKLSGYTLKNTGNWAHAIQNSCNIYAEKIRVLGGHDGFDMRSCDNANLAKCEFYTGDDAIAGFDNVDVTIRDCVLNSSCSAMRFGGTNVLVENCINSSPNRYGFRGTLSDEEKKRRAKTTLDNSRFNCLTAFLYYCDFRAKIRETPGNIVIKNCSFKNIDSVFSLPFGHIWVCNRSLESITFENCEFDGIVRPININCPEDEQLTFTMKNCKISASGEAKNEMFMVAHNFKAIMLENVEILGYDSPQINYSTAGDIIFKNTRGVTLKKTEKCTESGY